MKQQTDKFFRDKLAQHQVAPPPAAWDRIESDLSKKNNPATFWLKIAASLLIVATAAYVLWPEESETGRTATHESTTPVQDDSVKKQQQIPTSVKETTDKLVAENKPEESKGKKPKTTTVKKDNEEKAERKTETTTPNINPVEQKEPAPTVIDNVPGVIHPNAIAQVDVNNKANVTASEKNIKITISAAESEKFLDKNSLAEATPDEKKTSTLKKLLDKAEDMDPFGDLRQKKNEILALNFRSEKNQRGQNK